jgi:hypothetical protein
LLTHRVALAETHMQAWQKVVDVAIDQIQSVFHGSIEGAA